MEFSSSSSSGSSKRAKTPSNHITISVSCLVDGCASDLSQCREYHRRHKVCELHSKTPKVTIGGREQRFCQQCSRFHSLTEFDEGKRSCRKRLDGHNRRRRKPPSDSVSRTAGMFLSSQHGTRILSFASPQIHPSAVVGSDWAGKPLNAATPFDSHPLPLNCFDRHNLYSDSSSSSSSSAAQSGNKGGGRAAANQFHLFQCGPTLAASADNHHRAGNSNRALSLLSSPEPTHQVPEIVQPTPSGLGQYAFAQEMDNEGVISDSNGDNDGTTLQFQGMFHNERGGSSPSDAQQQTLSFRWD